MMMVDDGWGRGVKNGRKSDDVINGRPPTFLINSETNDTLLEGQCEELFESGKKMGVVSSWGWPQLKKHLILMFMWYCN